MRVVFCPGRRGGSQMPLALPGPGLGRAAHSVKGLGGRSPSHKSLSLRDCEVEWFMCFYICGCSGLAITCSTVLREKT